MVFVYRAEMKETKAEASRNPSERSALNCLVTYFFCILQSTLMAIGGILDMWLMSRFKSLEPGRDGYKWLYKLDFTLYIWYYIKKCRAHYEVPVYSLPAATITLADLPDNEYELTEEEASKRKTVINFASYNYLGLSQNEGPCTEAVLETLRTCGYTIGLSRKECGGTTEIHRELERRTAEFVEKEDAIAYSMGFATNHFSIPSLLKEGTLVVSDSKNHNSIINGIKNGRSVWRRFGNNDVHELEMVIQQAIIDGRPGFNVYTPWTNIIIIVEGIYSMEGNILDLPKIIAIKKKYKAFLYVDEAHSIGALGKRGRGVVDYWGCDFKDVDIMMGTYTKSFGGAGGYIAGDKDVISHIRNTSPAHGKSHAITPPVASQIITVLKILSGKDGTDLGAKLINSLAQNTKHMRKNLKKRGLYITGSDDSPVVPILVCLSQTLSATVVYLQKHGVGIAPAGFPSVPLGSAVLRMCISAGHTKEQLDEALQTICEASDVYNFRMGKPEIES